MNEIQPAILSFDPARTEHMLAGEIEWSSMARLRDRLAHHYWRTDSNIVWATATTSVPQLKEELVSALARLR